MEDGLPSSEIYQVKQDSKGYIWFATGNGVSRFDGYEFKNFSLKDGLPDNTVFEIFEDAGGRIWFLPLSCRLSYYQDGKIYPYPYNYILQRFVNPIKCSFYVDEKGSVFIGISNKGIFEITARGKLITHASRKTHPGVYSVMEPSPSQLVFYGNGTFGTKPWIESGIPHRPRRFPLPLIPPNSNAFYVFRLIRLHDHTLVFSFHTRLFRVTEKGEVTFYDFPKRINWLYEDRDNDLWVGMYQQGVYHLPQGDFSQKKGYLYGNSVDGVLQDREGGFWFTTEGNHVFYTPSKKVFVLDKNSGLQEDRVNCLAAGETDVFAGMREGFLVRISDSLNVKEWRFDEYKTQDNDIQALYYNEDNKEMVVSGRGQVFRFKENRMVLVRQSANIFYRMVKSTDGRHWGGFSFGLYSYDDFNVNQRLPKIQRVNGMLASADNHILLGAIDGLWDFDCNTFEFKYLGDSHPLLKNRIMDIEFLADSVLVMATKGAGILVYDFKNAFRIDENQGLCGNNVNELFVDGHTVWAATNQGLNRITFRPGQTPGYTVEGYTIHDGLPSDEIKDVVGANGRIWVATHKGLGFFRPKDMALERVECPILINRVQVNDRDTAVLDEYRLGYTQNSLKIGFTGLGYRNAGKLHYRYRMLGLDSNWAYTDNREIQFTTLPGGEYRFVVSVRNNDGTWSNRVATARFLILTPFWQKWWFQAGGILFLVVLAVTVIRYRLKLSQKIKERDNELNRNLLTLKLKALRAQMNPHFTFNVMNSIQHFILSKDEESAHRYLSKFSRLIRTILNNSESDTVPLAEEMKALELYLELESMRFDHAFSYQIEMDKAMDPARIRVPSMLMQPYVENAILHGILPLKTGGKIRVRLWEDGPLLKCVIEDNGVGRAKAAETQKHKEHKSFGTAITKERLSTINALHNSFMSENVEDLYDEEGRPAGTRIVIYIPLIKTDEHESDHY